MAKVGCAKYVNAHPSPQRLNCQNLITPLAQGSLTERFLALKSNPQIRWLNLIYVDFMRARPQTIAFL